MDVGGFDGEAERDRRYFAEALAALRWMPEQGTAVDVGTGGGSPALPMAIAREGVLWTFVESNTRKALFLEEAASALGLSRVKVHGGRFEELGSAERSDVVTVRGVRVTEALGRRLMEQLGSGGRLLWFSSKTRLSTETVAGSGRTKGPFMLVEGGAFLLVVEPRE